MLNSKYISIVSNLPLASETIIKLVKCNCTKSSRRTGKRISKKTRLYYRTFFAFSLNIVCKNQDNNDNRIVDTNHVED